MLHDICLQCKSSPSYRHCNKLLLTLRHCLLMQDCFILPGPPNFFISLQKWHSPQSDCWQFSHLRHLVLRLRVPVELPLTGGRLWWTVFTLKAFCERRQKLPEYDEGSKKIIFWTLEIPSRKHFVWPFLSSLVQLTLF